MEAWRKCGPCKKSIGFGETYFSCSVSSCRKQVFCSQDCFLAHVPMMRHRDAWPEEGVAPAFGEAEPLQDDAPILSRGLTGPLQPPLEDASRRRVVAGTSPSASRADASEAEVLIVASKLKAYVKTKSGLNTSQSVIDQLSTLVRRATDLAIAEAVRNGRKTLMDRDFSQR